MLKKFNIIKYFQKLKTSLWQMCIHLDLNPNKFGKPKAYIAQ
jgi:hypothetical protein